MGPRLFGEMDEERGLGVDKERVPTIMGWNLGGWRGPPGLEKAARWSSGGARVSWWSPWIAVMAGATTGGGLGGSEEADSRPRSRGI